MVDSDGIPHYTNVPFNLDIDPHGQFFNVPGDLLNRQGETLTFALTIQRIEIFGGLPFIYNLFVYFGALIATRLSISAYINGHCVARNYDICCLRVRNISIVLHSLGHCCFNFELRIHWISPFKTRGVDFKSEPVCKGNLISILYKSSSRVADRHAIRSLCMVDSDGNSLVSDIQCVSNHRQRQHEIEWRRAMA
jgi:hypothetical protein